MGVDWRDRSLIGNLYMGQKMRVGIVGEYSEAENVLAEAGIKDESRMPTVAAAIKYLH